jgi:hypothetical protein
MLAAIKEWEMSERESRSHHILKFNLNFACDKTQIYNLLRTRYIIKEQHIEFYKTFLQLISKIFQIEDNEGNAKETDEKIKAKLT